MQSTLREDQKKYSNRKISFTMSVRKKTKGIFRGDARSVWQGIACSYILALSGQEK